MSYRRSQDASNSQLLTVQNNIVGIAPGVTDPFMLGSSSTLVSTPHQQTGDFVTTEGLQKYIFKKLLFTVQKFDDKVNKILSDWMFQYCTEHVIDMEMMKYHEDGTVTYKGVIYKEFEQNVNYPQIDKLVKEKITGEGMLIDSLPMLEDGWMKYKVKDRNKTMKKKFKFRISRTDRDQSLLISISPASSRKAYGNQPVPNLNLRERYERCFDNFKLRVKVNYDMSIQSKEGKYVVSDPSEPDNEEFYEDNLQEVAILFKEVYEHISQAIIDDEDQDDVIKVRLTDFQPARILRFIAEKDCIIIYK